MYGSSFRLIHPDGGSGPENPGRPGRNAISPWRGSPRRLSRPRATRKPRRRLDTDGTASSTLCWSGTRPISLGPDTTAPSSSLIRKWAATTGGSASTFAQATAKRGSERHPSPSRTSRPAGGGGAPPASSAAARAAKSASTAAAIGRARFKARTPRPGLRRRPVRLRGSRGRERGPEPRAYSTAAVSAGAGAGSGSGFVSRRLRRRGRRVRDALDGRLARCPGNGCRLGDSLDVRSHLLLCGKARWSGDHPGRDARGGAANGAGADRQGLGERGRAGTPCAARRRQLADRAFGQAASPSREPGCRPAIDSCTRSSSDRVRTGAGTSTATAPGAAR